jgi:hypothetical protein
VYYGEFEIGAGFSYRLQVGIDYNQANDSRFMPLFTMRVILISIPQQIFRRQTPGSSDQ